MIHKNSWLKEQFETFLIQEVSQLNKPLVLEIIQIGDNFASTKYVQYKQKMGRKLGIEVMIHKFSELVDASIIQGVVNQAKNNGNGLIIQLPVADKFNPVVSSIPYFMDVDMLSTSTEGLWQKGFLPPTIGAIDLTIKHILKTYNFPLADDLELSFNHQFLHTQLDFKGLNVAVIGRGVLVGLPAMRYFSERGANIISIDKDTENPKELCRQANLVLSAAGHKNLLDKTWFGLQTIIIDAATTESGGSLVGDVDQTNLPPDAILSPSPGGIGGLTVLFLFYNLFKLKMVEDSFPEVM